MEIELLNEGENQPKKQKTEPKKQLITQTKFGTVALTQMFFHTVKWSAEDRSLILRLCQNKATTQVTGDCNFITETQKFK